MKKQFLILISAIVLVIGIFLFTTNPSSSSGTLLDIATEILETDGISYASEDEASSASIEEREAVLHDGMVFVDVQGEVVYPGVFEVNSDVRIGYLIDLAGGLTDYANVRGLNQAARIYDEMMIFVPHVDDANEVMIGIDSNDESMGQIDESGLISLSEASALELQSLPGVGSTLSANIIAYREERGSFSTIDELVNVAGIGARTLENIREFVKP